MEFRRDRLTWVAYGMLAFFAYLQTAPGLVIGHLRDELGLSYAAGGLLVAAFAAGSVLAGAGSGPLERMLGRRTMLWASATLMSAGTVGFVALHSAAAVIGSVLVMGLGGGLLLVTIQAILADHHGQRRAIAFAESNVAASLAYVLLAAALSLAAASGIGWRAAVLAALGVPVVAWIGNRHLALEAPQAPSRTAGSLPAIFWVAAAMVFCTTGAEWCITAWGASFVREATGVSTDASVALMAGYFAGVVTGRLLVSRLSRVHDPSRLLAHALAVAAAGFVLLRTSSTPLPAVTGLMLLGIGLGSLFPLGLSVIVALAPDRAQLASARTVVTTSLAVLLVPLFVGALADAASLGAAIGVVPAMLALAAAGLAIVRRRLGVDG